MTAKSIAILLIDQFADWEAAFLTSTAKTHLGAKVDYLSDGGHDMTSMGGLRVAIQDDWRKFDADRHDALAVIGSPLWMKDEAPDISTPVMAMVYAHKPVGFICGAVRAAARIGLLDSRSHTANSRDELKSVPQYKGEAFYIDRPQAVSDEHVVTAAGTAPLSFANEMLKLLYPGAASDLAAYAEAFAQEHGRK